MADYSVISDASNALLRLLRKELSPEPMQSPEAIALASPSDKNGDFQLGIFLYDIQELNEFRVSAQVRGVRNTRTYPDKLMSLSYMVFLNSKAQIASGAETEQRILGRVIQTIMDNPNIDFAVPQPYSMASDDVGVITVNNPTFEDKTRIWSTLNLPYQVALYLTVAPVAISSHHSEEFSRVVRAEFKADTMPEK